MTITGQGAIKYLRTYGWEILIVLIAGVLVWQMSIIGSPAQASGKSGFSGFSEVTPLNWSLTPDPDAGNTLTVVVYNNASLAVRLDGSDATMDVPGYGLCNSATPDSVDVFWPATAQELTFENCIIDNPKLGDIYQVNVTIAYTNISSGARYKSNGVIWGSIGQKSSSQNMLT